MASTWEIGDKHGVSFRAERIERPRPRPRRDRATRRHADPRHGGALGSRLAARPPRAPVRRRISASRAGPGGEPGTVRSGQSTSVRHPRMTSVLWGWRLEGALALGAYVALRLSSLVGPGGPVLLVGLAAIAAWQLPTTAPSAARPASIRSRPTGRDLGALALPDPRARRSGPSDRAGQRPPRRPELPPAPARGTARGVARAARPRDRRRHRRSRGATASSGATAPRSPSSSSSPATSSSTGSSDPPCSTPSEHVAVGAHPARPRRGRPTARAHAPRAQPADRRRARIGQVGRAVLDRRCWRARPDRRRSRSSTASRSSSRSGDRSTETLRRPGPRRRDRDARVPPVRDEPALPAAARPAAPQARADRPRGAAARRRRRARALPARRHQGPARPVRRGAARPGLARPCRRRHRRRGDPEAEPRGRPHLRPRPLQLPDGDALHVAGRLRHDPRPGLGDTGLLGVDDRSRAARRRLPARRGRDPEALPGRRTSPTRTSPCSRTAPRCSGADGDAHASVRGARRGRPAPGTARTRSLLSGDDRRHSRPGRSDTRRCAIACKDRRAVDLSELLVPLQDRRLDPDLGGPRRRQGPRRRRAATTPGSSRR